MEIIPEGKNFRLVHENELIEILQELDKYIPEALKVSVNVQHRRDDNWKSSSLCVVPQLLFQVKNGKFGSRVPPEGGGRRKEGANNVPWNYSRDVNKRIETFN